MYAIHKILVIYGYGAFNDQIRSNKNIEGEKKRLIQIHNFRNTEYKKNMEKLQGISIMFVVFFLI